MDDALKVVGTVCRYILAVLACWWFFWFLALMGQPADRSQELAGTAFAKAILCGAAAAFWFYRARKAKAAKNLSECSQKPKQLIPTQLEKVILSSEPQEVTPASGLQQDSDLPAVEQPTPPPVVEDLKLETMAEPTPGWLIIFGIILAVVVIGIAVITIKRPTGSPSVQTTPPNSIDDALNQPNPSGPTPRTDGLPLGFVLECPTALPSGVVSKPLNSDDLSKVVGTDGKLASEQSYDSLNAPNGTAWNALLSFTNKTNSCITMAMVEFELNHAGIVSKERHSIVFQPLLGVGETQTVSVALRIRTPERSEDVALLGWRAIDASGFGSGGDPPTNNEDELQPRKDQRVPIAAHGGYEITPPNSKTEPAAKVTIPADAVLGRLLQKTPPVYPPIAAAARVSGTVVLQAIISKQGTIESLRVVSGPALLQQAALDAVRTWQYKPYTVNNKPVEVETTVNVVFTLGD